VILATLRRHARSPKWIHFVKKTYFFVSGLVKIAGLLPTSPKKE